MQAINWQYDAFISYHVADETWVREWLIPRLEADGVRVCTERDTFDIGVSRGQNVENAVTASRHTVLVLTPDWVRDEWNQFESIIQHVDPMGLRQRTLPLLRHACKLPLRLAALTPADFTRSDIEAQYHKLLDTLHGRRFLSSLDDFGAPALPPPPPVAPATARQATLGFHYDPFAFPFAEHMPQDVLEETFISHDGFTEHIMNLDRSAVLLAPTGGGKTASRRLLEAHLERCHTRALTGDISGPSIAALTVIYNDFEAIIENLPQVRIADHVQPLLGAVATAIYSYIVAHQERFMSLNREHCDWWWSFLDIYLPGELLPLRLLDHVPLNAAYDKRKTIHQSIFRPSSSLPTILTTLLQRLRSLQIERIFILVDEMDNAPEIQSPSSVAAVAMPLLKSLSLLSLSGVVWKFFLPDVLEQAVASSSGYTTGRLPLVPIMWHGHYVGQPLLELTQLLRQRLLWASEDKISDIDGLANQELARAVKIEQELVEMALRHRHLGPPRALLALGGQLLEMMGGQQISLKEWEVFKAKVAFDITP
jgi:hypothetical protein